VTIDPARILGAIRATWTVEPGTPSPGLPPRDQQGEARQGVGADRLVKPFTIAGLRAIVESVLNTNLQSATT
jgi:hypothetical protein